MVAPFTWKRSENVIGRQHPGGPCVLPSCCGEGWVTGSVTETRNGRKTLIGVGHCVYTIAVVLNDLITHTHNKDNVFKWLTSKDFLIFDASDWGSLNTFPLFCSGVDLETDAPCRSTKQNRG